MNEEELDLIYKMELHDALQFDDYEMLRVPGGWIYTRFTETGTGGYSCTSCFVRNEFQ